MVRARHRMSSCIANALLQRWGQAVIVENKPGAAGAIGADLVAKSEADGHTLMLGF